MNTIKQQKYETARLYKFRQKEEVKLKKDGTPKATVKNSNKGDIHRVHPFKTEQEIYDVITYYEKKIETSKTNEQKRIAGRNMMLITVGINMGIRASDLIRLKWGQIFYENGEFINEDDDVEIREKKTGKVKGLVFNDASKSAIMEYINTFNINIDLNTYVFKSREGGHINVKTVSGIVKEAAAACGIKRRIGSHTLRKTFSWFQIKAHNDNSMFINELQGLLNHSSPEISLSYSDLTSQRLKEYHDDVNLGKKCVIKTLTKENNDKIVVESSDIAYLIKQLGEVCYSCDMSDCNKCMNNQLAKKYGYDLNTI